MLTDHYGIEMAGGLEMKSDSGWSYPGKGTNSNGCIALPEGFQTVCFSTDAQAAAIGAARSPIR